MRIYFSEGEALRGEAGEQLVLEANRRYSAYMGREAFPLPEIARSENGKPYFRGGDALPHFSVSHSGELWCCLMADFPVGIDIQEKSSRTSEALSKLAKRYFSDAEAAYSDLYGEDAFYRIWTRKEALVKLTDGRLYSTLKNISLLDSDYELTEELSVNGKTAYFGELEIGEGICCSYCVSEREHALIEFL